MFCERRATADCTAQTRSFNSRANAKKNSFAVAGMIFGIVSFLCCCKFLFGALGIVFSLIGLSQINRHPELYEGRGLAIAGLVLSILSLLLALALIAFALATGNFHFNWNFNHS